MKSNDFIFTSYCFDNSAAGGDYKAQQDRLRESILKIYPDANLHFKSEPEHIGKPKFQKSLYGFKVELVEECLAKGFKKIIFFDAAICLEKTVDYWFDIVKTRGILAPVDRQTLNNVTSNNCMNAMGYTREKLSEINLVGGSIYVFDFDTQLCNDIFVAWSGMEALGLFGTQDDLSYDRLQGHRMDETCMALAFHTYGIKPLGHDLMRYAYEHPGTKQIHGEGYEPIVIKRHFK